MSETTVRVVVEPDFEEKILSDPGWERSLVRLAVPLVAIAKSLAPHRTNKLRNSIKAVPMLTAGGWYLVLMATDFKALWHERGTSKMDPNPFLTPAVRTVLPSAIIVEGAERSFS